MLTLLSLILLDPAGSALGSEDYAAREAAESVLRWCGPVAWGKLSELRSSESAEVRLRVDGMLEPARRLDQALRAARVLLCPEPDYGAAFGDEWLRLEVLRLAKAMGGAAVILDGLDPRTDDWSWFSAETPMERFARNLDYARGHVQRAIK